MALVKSRIWPHVGYVPHAVQRTIHRSRARHRVAGAGRRLGKSVIGGHELTIEALATKGREKDLLDAGLRREFWIVGPEYSDSEKEFRVLWNDAQRLKLPMDKPGSYNNPQSGEMMMSLWNGTFIVHAKSAKYPGTLVGEGLSGVLMVEAAKLKPVVWTKYIRPTLADFRGWSLWLSTPEGLNHFHDAWKRGQDPTQPDWESWRFPSWMNPIVFPNGEDDQEVKDLRAEMSEEKFNQEIGASFTEFVGRVFKDFDEMVHVKDLVYNPTLPLYIATDYGWTNPFVVLLIQVDTFDNVYVLGEYRTQGRDTTEVAKDLLTWRGGLAKKATELYPDPASPGDSNILAKSLGLKVRGGTGGEIKHRLEYIRQWLKLLPVDNPDAQPRLFFDRSIVDGTNEMGLYRYPDTKEEATKAEPENPMKINDHFPEALGRFFAGYFGPIERPGRKHARVSRAKVHA